MSDRIAKQDEAVLKAPTASQTVTLSSGGTHTVKDHTGATIFEIRDNGSVHIKLGTLVVADL